MKPFENMHGILDEDLEKFIMAIRRLRDKEGHMYGLMPCDILQDWVKDVLEEQGHGALWGDDL